MVRFETNGRPSVSAKEKPSETPPAGGDDNAAAGEDAPKKKGLGLIPMIAGAIVAAGVAGGAAFVLTPGAKEESPACADSASEDGAHGESAAAEECVAEDHGDAKKKSSKKAADKGHGGGHGGDSGPSAVKPLGEVQHTDYATFLVLDPMVVSISPIGRSKHLKISLVLETDEDGAAALLDRGFYIQDVLNTFLRSVDSQVLEDPAAMSRLRAQILRRVRAIVPDANIQNVLITEFVLT